MILRPKPEDINTCPLWEFYRWVENRYRLPVIAEVRGDCEWSLRDKPDCCIEVDWRAKRTHSKASLATIEWNNDSRVSRVVVVTDYENQRMATLHELGHAFNNREGEELISKEVSAWNWAFKEAKKIGLKYDRAKCLREFSSYLRFYTKPSLRAAKSGRDIKRGIVQTKILRPEVHSAFGPPKTSSSMDYAALESK